MFADYCGSFVVPVVSSSDSGPLTRFFWGVNAKNAFKRSKRSDRAFGPFWRFVSFEHNSLPLLPLRLRGEEPFKSVTMRENPWLRLTFFVLLCLSGENGDDVAKKTKCWSNSPTCSSWDVNAKNAFKRSKRYRRAR